MKALITILIALSPTVLIAQNLKKEKVKTSTLEYPKIALSENAISTLSVEFCSGELAFKGTKSVKEGAMCKNEATDKIMMLEVYRLDVYTESTASYLRIKNSHDEVLYMKRYAPTKTTYKFAEKNCYFIESFCTSAWEKKKEGFEATTNSKDYNDKYTSSKNSVNRALFFTYVNEEVEVHYPKSKNVDYSDLEKAAGIAAEGYKILKGKTGDAAGNAKLAEAIAIWEKALEESAVENKAARINKKVTLVIMENMARAYGYMMEFEKALKTINDELKIEGNFSNNKTQVRKALRRRLEIRSDAYDKNKNRTITMEKTRVKVGKAPSTEFSTFESDYKSHSREPLVAYDPKATGGANPDNPLRKLLTKSTTSVTLMIPSIAAGMVGLPQYAKKQSEFPMDICGVTDVTVLILKGTITSIPPCIGDLTELTKINFANNSLMKLPDEIGQLENLKTLNLSGNPMPASEVSRIQALLPDCKVKFK